MSRVLTVAELIALTDCTQPAAQIRWLEANGWRYTVGNSGRPKVAESFFEHKLGAHEKVHVMGVAQGLDLAALDRATRRA